MIERHHYSRSRLSPITCILVRVKIVVSMLTVLEMTACLIISMSACVKIVN